VATEWLREEGISIGNDRLDRRLDVRELRYQPSCGLPHRRRAGDTARGGLTEGRTGVST
jgi:hypothetical protein